MVVPYAEKLVEQQNGRLTPTQTRVLDRKIHEKFIKEFDKANKPKKEKKRKITKAQSESIRSAQRGRFITPTQSRSVGRAVTGILGAFLPQEAMAGSVSYAKKGSKGTGKKGRPVGTYKARYLPDGRIVKVPTHIYRRMLSEAKAKRRLAEAQQQARMQQQYEAEQIAMQQDPRFAQAQTDEQFLEGPDMEHEAQVTDIRQQQLYQQQAEQMRRQQAAQSRSGFATRTGAMFGKLGGGLWGPQSQQFGRQDGQQVGQQVGQPYSARQVQGIIRPQLNPNQYRNSEPQVVVTSGKSIMFSKAPSILGQSNEFNRPRNAVIERGGVRRRNHL